MGETPEGDTAMMTYEETLEIVKDWDVDEAIERWNQFCEDNCYEDLYIRDNDGDALDDFFTSPREAVEAVCRGDYKWEDAYAYTENGDLYSFSDLDEETCPIEPEDIARFITLNQCWDAYGIDETALEVG